MAGDTAKAKAAYNDFLTLWKDADPDIPIPKQAKAEYTNLQSQPWPVLSIDASRPVKRSQPGEPKKEKLSCPKVNRPCVPQSFACCLRTHEVCLRIDLATLRTDYLGALWSAIFCRKAIKTSPQPLHHGQSGTQSLILTE